MFMKVCTCNLCKTIDKTRKLGFAPFIYYKPIYMKTFDTLRKVGS